jgi:hypothetical protein
LDLTGVYPVPFLSAIGYLLHGLAAVDRLMHFLSSYPRMISSDAIDRDIFFRFGFVEPPEVFLSPFLTIIN